MKKLIIPIVLLVILIGIWVWTSHMQAPVATVPVSSTDTTGMPPVTTDTQPPVPAPASTSELTLQLDTPASAYGTTITVTGVTQDSRCPSDVNCIQAGKATISVKMVTASTTVPTNGVSSMSIGDVVSFGGLSITLDDVAPHPVSTHKTVANEYRFMFTVKKPSPIEQM